jgi:hypothetical protein
MRAWAEDPAMPPVLLFGHPRELAAWMDTLLPR